MPSNYQRPFDPAIAVTDDGKYRIYFSSGTLGSGGLTNQVNTYSALSTDGINYTFDSDARFDHLTNPVIDPTILKFNGLWHYVAPKGAPQDGAFHATSLDGIIFTSLADIPSDNSHNWTGNLMQEDVAQVRFYGSGPKVWWSSTVDATSWSSYTATNVQGGDPAVMKIGPGNYMMIYVGKNQTITESRFDNLAVAIYPNPVWEAMFIALPIEISAANLNLFNSSGQVVMFESLQGSFINEINVENLPAGIYFARITSGVNIIHHQTVLVIH